MTKKPTTESKSELEALRKELVAKNKIIESKNNLLEKKDQKIQKLQGRLEELLHSLKLSQKHRFGRKSEKLVTDQEEPEIPPKDRVFDEATKEEATSSKGKGGRKPLPQDLPHEETIHDLPKDQKICSCGSPLHKIGEETCEQLEVIPANVVVRRHVRLKYGCKKCEDTVLLAKSPSQAIPKSMASAGLLAHVLVSKYDDHLPLYRQAEIWGRAGVDLDRSTLGRWMLKCGDLLAPLVQRMRQDLLNEPYIQADETVVQVLQEEQRKNTSKSYMWVYKTKGNNNYKVVYEYSPSRGAEVAATFLGDFKGILQSDGYKGYGLVCKDSKGTIESAGCWAHARRKFFEVAESAQKPTVSLAALNAIKQLYDIERMAKEEGLPPDKITEFRKKEAEPILKKLKDFLEKYAPKVPPKSGLGQAIGYTLRQWNPLTTYVENGHIAIDNNAVERCIRPFAVGRKNWLFKGSVAGAKAGATIYSLLETAKSYGLNPYEYFADILKKLPAGDPIDNLLPYTWKVPK